MHLLHLPSTTSTMDIAARLVKEGSSLTNTVLADVQTAGRGRNNRPWSTFSAPHSLAATFIFRPTVGPQLPLVAALALHTALKDLLPKGSHARLHIKWPNDVLLSGRKLAGILCENIADPPTSLIGIGVNLTPPEEPLPQAFAGAFLSESVPTPPTPREWVRPLHTCLSQHIALYKAQGWSAFHDNYLRHCATIGQEVVWKSTENQQLTGIARGLTQSGHLELEAEDGTMHVIHSGDIIDKHH